MLEIAIGALIAPAIWYGLTTAALYGYRATGNLFLLWPAQFSALAIATVPFAMIASGDDGVGIILLITLIFPPIVLLGLLATDFLLVTLVPVGLVALVAASIPRKTRAWAPVLATLAMGLSMPLTADTYWDRQMCARAAHHGLTDIQRAPFLYNLRRAGSKSGRDPYAIASKDGVVWDWGYSRSDFVRYGGDIPDRVDTSALEPLSCGR